MFIAQMFCYGKDGLTVGVDGIRGCMGVFLHYGNMLYAIHLPDNPNKNKLGRDTFCDFVQAEIADLNGANASLYAVLNNNNRPDFLEELRDIGTMLKVQNATIVRVMDHLPKQGALKEPAAAAVLLDRVHGGTCVLKYQDANKVKWEPGGTARSGYYHNGSFTDSVKTSGAVSHGWHLVNAQNSSIRSSRLYA